MDKLQSELFEYTGNGSKPCFLGDSVDYSGLRLAAYKTGRKTWFYRYRHKITGILKQIKIGSFSADLDLTEARREFSILRLVRDKGGCPASELKNRRIESHQSQYTINQMLEHYMVEHVDISRNDKSSSEFARLVNRDIYPTIGKLSVSELDIDSVQSLIDSMSRSTAESVRVSIGAAFEWAIRMGRIDSERRKDTYRIKTGFYKTPEYS